MMIFHLVINEFYFPTNEPSPELQMCSKGSQKSQWMYLVGICLSLFINTHFSADLFYFIQVEIT